VNCRPHNVCLLLVWVLLASHVAFANPGDRFQHARTLMHEGNHEAALAAFDTLVGEYPEDVDFAFARAQALTALGRRNEAVDQLDAAIQLAPDYEDVWRARHRLVAQEQDSVDLAAFRERAAQQFPQSTWWQEPEAPETQRWTLLMGAGADQLSDGFDSWNNQFAELHFAHNTRQRYAIRVARDARGSSDDISTGASMSFNHETWFTGASLSFSSSPDFQSDASLDAHVGRPFGDGWSGVLRYRYRGFENATVSGVVLGVEKYFGDYRIAYDLGASRLHGASSFMNHVLTGNWFYRDEASVGVSLSTGREAEAIGGGRVLETDVAGIAISGRHPLSERVGLQWWLGLHEQGDLYRRRFLGMAVSIKL